MTLREPFTGSPCRSVAANLALVRVEGRTVLVTGAAAGIGRALALACAAAGARVFATDLSVPGTEKLAAELGPDHLAEPCDVADEGAFTALLRRVPERLGPIEICFANAGIAVGGDPLSTPPPVWERAFAVNVGAHVTAARELLPGWLERGEGYFVATASAAGLLTQVGSAPYSVSKHACVAFAEWLSVTYGDRGLRVSAICPMGVETAMLESEGEGAIAENAARVVREAGAVLSPREVAAITLEAMEEEAFLVLPHPEVLDFFQRKAADYDRWLVGMRRFASAHG